MIYIEYIKNVFIKWFKDDAMSAKVSFSVKVEE